MPLEMRLSGAAALLALLLAGCAVGPDFKKPDAPQVDGYTKTPLTKTLATADVTGGDAQTFVQVTDLAGDWWTAFKSPMLNDLIAQALANNSDLKAAQATLRQAHENARAQKGAFYPQIGGQFAASRQEQPAATLAPVPANNSFDYNLFTPQLNISYAPDVFGLTRRTVESYQAQADAARYQLMATYTTLVNNVIAAAVGVASTQAEIEATNKVIDTEKKSVGILQYQKDKGYASGLDLAQQTTNLAAVQATLPPLIKQKGMFNDQLAVLVGKFPSQQPDLNLKLADLTLPPNLPVSLPSALVNQRPDVMQAEANMHAASAQIGIAVANRLPNLALSGNVGSSGLMLNQLFLPGTQFYTIAANLTAPIFDGGTLLHEERASRAAFDASAAQYKSTVLGAFQNVADTLTALDQDAAGLNAAAASDTAAKKSLDITQRQLDDGYNNPLGQLIAEQAFQQAEVTLLQAQAARYTDTAALFQALGGGWWNRGDITGETKNG